MAKFHDLMLTILLALICIPLVLIPPLNETPARIVIGLIFVLFLPGYSLIAFLFPRKKDLDAVERIALSFGLSIALVPLVGLILNYTFGIRLMPVLLSLAALTILLSIAAYFRRLSVPEEDRFGFDIRALFKGFDEFKEASRTDKILTVILLASILASIFTLIYVIVTPKQGERFTEFYILGEKGKASDYPTKLWAGQNATVIIGIVNHEYRTVNYTVEIWLVNASYESNKTVIHSMYFLDSFNVTLDHTPVSIEGNWTPQWEMLYNFSIDKPGRYKIWFLLFKDYAPPKPEKMKDYAGTEAEKRILDAIEGRIQALNLNVEVRSI